MTGADGWPPRRLTPGRLAYDLHLLNPVGDYIPMQLVVPSAVRIAEAIDTIICIAHFKVSFFVIVVCFLNG